MNNDYLANIKRKPALERLAYWIVERESIRLNREGKSAFVTADPILRTYRFCNVHREHDRVTKWIDTNWRKPNASSPYMWHGMIIARLLNWPDTLARIGWPEPWDQKQKYVRAQMLDMQKEGVKIFTGAYIVSTNGISTDKVSYVLETFDRAWASDDPPLTTDTLAVAFVKLREMHGMGSFMAAQVVADLKNTPYLRRAKDWHNWCAPGPGSMRGLARLKFDMTKEEKVMGRLINKATFVKDVADVRTFLLGTSAKEIAGKLCLQDLQNCLCEFDKYERVLWGQGKPRALYRSHGV